MLQSVAQVSRIVVLASACGLATVGALALIGTARADDAETRHSCSNATLKGTYDYASIAWLISAAGLPTPFAVAGFNTYDGKGNGTGVVTHNNGVVVTPNKTTSFTYSVKADCTGTLVVNLADGSIDHFNLYVSPSGNQFRWVGTDPGMVDAGTETRVAR